MCVMKGVPGARLLLSPLITQRRAPVPYRTLPYSLVRTAKLYTNLCPDGFLLSHLKFMVPEKLVPFVLQPHQQCRSEVGITPYLLHRADRTPQCVFPIIFPNPHPYPTSGFVSFHKMRPRILYSWG